MKTEFTPIDYNYEGIAKVILAFVELYKVCENKELIDNAFKEFISQKIIITEI